MSHYKIAVLVTPELSYFIQKLAFSQGIYWSTQKKKVEHTESPYLFLTDRLDLNRKHLTHGGRLGGISLVRSDEFIKEILS